MKKKMTRQTNLSCDVKSAINIAHSIEMWKISFWLEREQIIDKQNFNIVNTIILKWKLYDLVKFIFISLSMEIYLKH